MSSPTVQRSYPFAIANAFTQDPFGGNPAAIVFLDPESLNPLAQSERLKLANALNQPMSIFVTPSKTSAQAETTTKVSFDVQYFTSCCEVEVCGHATIAAMKVILDSAGGSPGFDRESQFPVFSPPETNTVEFKTVEGVVILARKLIIEDEDWFEITLPAATLTKLPTEEEKRVVGVLTQAMGKEPRVKYIGTGEPPFQHYLLIVLEESENIEELRLADVKALIATGFQRHVVTTDSTSGKFPEDYITRMFAPAAGIDEDPVCGSANCTMGPYWAAQKGVAELKARQVSERGGRLRVGVYGDKIKLRGQVRVTGVGRLFL